MSILAEADPAADRPETAAEQALTEQLQEGRAARAQQAAQQGPGQVQQGPQQAQQSEQQGQQPMEEDGGDGRAEAEGEAGDAAATLALPEDPGGTGPAPHAGELLG